jgi:hypothetical protein
LRGPNDSWYFAVASRTAAGGRTTLLLHFASFPSHTIQVIRKLRRPAQISVMDMAWRLKQTPHIPRITKLPYPVPLAA